MKKTIMVIFVLLFLFSCTAGPQEHLKIGVIGSLTGIGSYFGQQEIRGLELAKDEINLRGGINGRQIEFVIEDSKSEPNVAVTAIQKLINVDGTRFVIGDSWASPTGAIVPIANELGILLISPMASLDSLSQDDLFLRTSSNTKDMMEPLSKYAYQQGIQKVGLLVVDTPYGVEHARDFRAVFERLGGIIVGEELFDIKAADFRSELSKLNAKKPDAILNLQGGTNIGLVVKQADELGLNVKWLSSFGAETAPLLKSYGNIIEGMTYPYPYDANSNLPSVQAFISLYKAKYNETPDNTAANSYDALKVLAAAIGQAGEDPVEVKKAILAMKDFPGGSGLLSFDVNGDVKKEIIIKQVKNGQFVRIQ